MKKKWAIFLIFTLVIVFTGCDNTPKSYESIENTINYLTTSKLEGRLTGTEGGLKAEEYLKGLLKELKVEKYNEDYSVPYEHVFYNPKNQIHSISLITDGSNTSFQYGNDFIETICNDIDKELKFTFDAKNFSKDTVLVVEDRKVLKGLDISGKVVFIKENNFSRNVNSIDTLEKNSNHIIQISQKMYDTLEKNKNGTIKIQFKASSETITANNIVGRIKGKDSKKAIVLSAHFDHVGMAGKNIFKGAIDNGSGVATLLDITKKLKEYYKDTIPERDIIICFFNGEESYLQGSKAFVKTLEKDYSELYNINLDCIGMKDGGDLIIITKDNKNSGLMKDLKSHFEGKGYSLKAETMDLVSDHVAFLKNNIAAVSIGQMNIEKAQTTEDTIKNIDIEYLSNLSSNLFEFLIKNNNSHYEIEKQSGSTANEGTSSEEQQKSQETLNKLKPHEYLKTEKKLYTNMDITLGEVEKSDGELEKLETYYPTLSVKKQVDSFKLNSVNISERLQSDFEKLEANKTYVKEFNLKDVDKIRLSYKKEEKESFDINILIEDTTKEDYITMNDYYMMAYNIESNKKDINGDIYNVCSKLEDNAPDAVYKKIKLENKVIHIFITTNNLDIISNINIKPAIDDLVNLIK